jgi:hypothetical protein
MPFTFAYKPEMLRVIVAADKTRDGIIFYHKGILPASCPAMICEIDYNRFIPDRMNRITDQGTRSNKAYHRNFLG